MTIVQRVAELSRVLFDVIIVDTAGRMGPATGAILRAADVVLVVMDDTILGLTAVDLYLSFVKTLVGGTDGIVFVVNPYSGALLGVSEIAKELEPAHHLGDEAWRLPPIPNDPRAALWPGSGRTLYSMGQKLTRSTLETIARELNLIDDTGAQDYQSVGGDGGGSWFKRMFGRKEAEV
jgi:cellulose biosynthesis protein BcsQ